MKGDTNPAHAGPTHAANVASVDEARAVIDRLARIEALDRDGAPPGVLLAELRGLVQEAETWARCEADDRAVAAAMRCADAVAVRGP